MLANYYRGVTILAMLHTAVLLSNVSITPGNVVSLLDPSSDIPVFITLLPAAWRSSSYALCRLSLCYLDTPVVIRASCSACPVM